MSRRKLGNSQRIKGIHTIQTSLRVGGGFVDSTEQLALPIESKVIGSRGLMCGSTCFRLEHLPSQTGQHWPGTLRGLEHRASHSMDLHSALPWTQVHVVQSFSFHVALLCTTSPDPVIHPEMYNDATYCSIFTVFRYILKQVCNLLFDKIILYLVHHINQIMVCLS